MALCTVGFKGEAIGKQTAMNVLVPDTGRGPFPVLYLLHGLSDDYTIWLRRSRIEVHAARHRLIVVMPDGDRSFYLNDAETGPYEDHMLKDVIGTVDRLFPTLSSREGRAIAGLSMGGFGALYLGLTHPDLFGAMGAHSSAILTGDMPAGYLTPRVRARVVAECENLMRIGDKRKPSELPAIRMDCGLDDGLLAGNRRLHERFDAQGIAHTYKEFPGGHSWDYWDEHVRETLAFVMEHLAKK